MDDDGFDEDDWFDEPEDAGDPGAAAAGRGRGPDGTDDGISEEEIAGAPGVRALLVADVVRRLRDDPKFSGVTAFRHYPAEEGRLAAFPDHLGASVRAAYRAGGVTALWSHQREALDAIHRGENVAVVTPTASGKTLCYNAAVLDRLAADPGARALYLFPTKALSQDQLKELGALASRLDPAPAAAIAPAVFDGDTPADSRREIRNRSRVVITNPDMLHVGVLPQHTKWARLFARLHFVVIDEMHAYRGVFGSHLANLLRRLRRVCRHYGSDPRIVLGSATIRNPKQLAERLTGSPVTLVSKSGAPRAERFFVFYNPPLVNPDLGVRRSYLGEARRIAGLFLRKRLQTLVFARSRRNTEVLVRYLKRDHEKSPADRDRIRGYRGGYFPRLRREIEKGLRDGVIRGVVSTNALELGIDIGSLDATVLAGYPGTIASTWQQAGRAGRRGGGAQAAVLVASAQPVDQFVIRHPEYFFEGTPERALVNPDNLYILLQHLKCAAFELPFERGDRFGSENIEEMLGVLEEDRVVHRSGDRWYWTRDAYPAKEVNLRTTDADNVVIHDRERGKEIGEVDFASAHSTLHDHAIHLHQSETFVVERFDPKNRRATVRRFDSDYYTEAITRVKVRVLESMEEARGAATGEAPGRSGRGPRFAHGDVHVAARVIGFKKIRFFTNENVGAGEVETPPVEMHTTGFWIGFPGRLLDATPFAPEAVQGGLVGLRNVLRAVAATFLMCERHDIGAAVSSTRDESADGASPDLSPSLVRIFLYDNYPAGIGFSESLYEARESLFAAARDLIVGCGCPSGCPSCVGPVGEVGSEGKAAALAILGAPAVSGDPSARPTKPAARPKDVSPKSKDFPPKPKERPPVSAPAGALAG